MRADQLIMDYNGQLERVIIRIEAETAERPPHFLNQQTGERYFEANTRRFAKVLLQKYYSEISRSNLHRLQNHRL